MLYSILKIIVRLEMFVFCRQIRVNKPALLHTKGPLLIAANHPNSFLDAILIDILFDVPVWSLARGDAFKTDRIKNIFYKLKILPVYRTSEGVENLSENYKTFDACLALFKQNDTILIFSEGKCINEWHLRPLKKGTARLAIKAWEENINLQVLPVGINYQSFQRFGKNVFINFGNIITKNDIDVHAADGFRNHAFNQLLQKELEQLVNEIPKHDLQKRKEELGVNISWIEKILLFIPAVFGFILHAPLYYPVKTFVWNKTKGTDHFDSVMGGVLLLLYPVYVLLVTLLLYFIIKSNWAWLSFLPMYFTAYAYSRIKAQFGEI